MAATGRTATTKAMGKGSTQFQHLVETEVPPRRLEEWLELWTAHNGFTGRLRVTLRPHVAGSELLELAVCEDGGAKVANVIFAPIQDRRGRHLLSIRDQNTFSGQYRQKRLMTVVHLFLIHRYKAISVHYVTPTEDNQHQAEGMRDLGIYTAIQTEIGQIIVAAVAEDRVKELLRPDHEELKRLITKD
jgi:isocitrate lyase